MQKAQQDAWARCAARRDGQGSLNAASEFSPLYQIFPSFPHASEKSSMSREKRGTEGKIRSQVLDRWAGAGLECRATMAGLVGIVGRAGMGAGAGQGGWGTCVFLNKNVRRNRLECRFRAEYQGENPVFFSGFFPRGTGYFPRFPKFSPRKKSGEFKGKSRCYHLRSCILGWVVRPDCKNTKNLHGYIFHYAASLDCWLADLIVRERVLSILTWTKHVSKHSMDQILLCIKPLHGLSVID